MRPVFAKSMLATLFLGVPLSAQNNGFAKTDAIFNVSVVTTNNLVVTGLKTDQFEIHEGGKIKPIKSFVADDGPAIIGLVLDVSASMRPERGSAKRSDVRKKMSAALGQFIDGADPRDEFFILIFSSDVGSLQGFTTDRTNLTSALNKLEVFENKGNTKLWDALKSAFEVMSHASHQKKLIVLVGDGMDNASETNFDQVKRLARESNVGFFNVRPDTELDVLLKAGMSYMEELAIATGGSVYAYKSPDAFKEQLTFIGSLIKHRYRIGFERSANRQKDKDEWRKVKIRIQHSNADFVKHLIVFAPEGYYAAKR